MQVWDLDGNILKMFAARAFPITRMSVEWFKLVLNNARHNEIKIIRERVTIDKYLTNNRCVWSDPLVKNRDIVFWMFIIVLL